VFLPDLLKGKRILITGGGTGLGRNMGRRFLELGGEIAICGRRPEPLEETKAANEADFPGRTHTYRCDIRDAAAVEAMVDEIWSSQGPVNVLVNNAAGNIAGRYEDLSTRAIDAVVGIVLHGAAYMTHACGKRWIAEGTAPASVLSIVTTYAWTGSGYVTPSAMGKAGVLALTRSLAVEWGRHDIRLNAIAPGPFPTEGAWDRLVPTEELSGIWETRNPMGRVGRHEELNNLAAYLISDQAGYINGEVVTIDGGEWLGGAGQFNFLGQLSDEDWNEVRARAKKAR